jgi:hypothetical protein
LTTAGKKYREWEGPYPFVVFARGEGKTTTAFWPLFSRAHNDTLESDYYLWPLYRYNRLSGRWMSGARASCFICLSNVTEKNTGPARSGKRVDLWPLFTWHRDFNGNNAVANPRAHRAHAAQQPRRGTQLVAALVGVALGKQSPKPAPPASRCFGILPSRHGARCQKMLAPVRPFPVSIQCGGKSVSLFYIPVSKPNPQQPMKPEAGKWCRKAHPRLAIAPAPFYILPLKRYV